MTNLTYEYYIENYPKTMALVKEYVNAKTTFNSLTTAELDKFNATLILDDNDIGGDLLHENDELLAAIASVARNRKDVIARVTLGQALLNAIDAKFPKMRHLELAEMFEETEKHFKPQAFEYADEQALDNRDRALAMNRGC